MKNFEKHLLRTSVIAFIVTAILSFLPAHPAIDSLSAISFLIALVSTVILSCVNSSPYFGEKVYEEIIYPSEFLKD